MNSMENLKQMANENTATSIVGTDFDVPVVELKDEANSPSSRANIDEDSPIEIKAVEVPKQRKKKRTQKELAELNVKIVELYSEGFSENAISVMLDISKEYATKHILHALRTRTLELTPTIYEVVTGSISVLKLAELFVLADNDTKPLFQAELVADTIVLKPFNLANAGGKNHV